MIRRKHADDRKAEIVAALMVLADRIGPDRLTTNDIAREVGVTQAAIFRHFPTKAELWKSAGEMIAGRLKGAWDRSLAENRTPEAQLRGLIRTQLEQITKCPALPSVLFSRELNVDNADLRATFGAILREFHGHLAAATKQMQAAGQIRLDLSSDDAAILLTSLVQGMAIRWSLGARTFSLVEEGMRLLDRQLALFQKTGD